MTDASVLEGVPVRNAHPAAGGDPAPPVPPDAARSPGTPAAPVPPAGLPAARSRTTAVVWITVAVVGFAGLVALWMYWLSGMFVGSAG